MSVQDHLYMQDLPRRERAATSLRRTESRLVVRQLVAALKHRNRYVAIRAAWGLSLLPPRLAIAPLKKALHTSSRAVVQSAAWALGRIRSTRARQVLVDALKSRSKVVREQATGGLWLPALRGYRNKRVERMLAGMLRGDRGQIALTLRHMRSPRPVPKIKHPSTTFFRRMGGEFIR